MLHVAIVMPSTNMIAITRETNMVAATRKTKKLDTGIVITQ